MVASCSARWRWIWVPPAQIRPDVGGVVARVVDGGLGRCLAVRPGWFSPPVMIEVVVSTAGAAGLDVARSVSGVVGVGFVPATGTAGLDVARSVVGVVRGGFVPAAGARGWWDFGGLYLAVTLGSQDGGPPRRSGVDVWLRPSLVEERPAGSGVILFVDDGCILSFMKW